jgi:hypothetical protein
MSRVVWSFVAVGGALGIGYAVWRMLKGKSTPPAGADSVASPAEPKDVDTSQRINRSSHDEIGTVKQTAAELLAQAHRFDPAITMDELTGARLAASEHGSGSFAELAAIVDAELNRAKKNGVSLFVSLTHGGTFGSQGHERPASTRRDPTMRHLLAARAVLSGKARGISRGATRFFDPVAMERMHRRYRQWVRDGKQGKKPPIVSCDALGVLEAWSFDLGRDRVTGNRCPPDRTRKGKRTMAWVGEIEGVDPLRLMLMAAAPVGKEHKRRYAAARERLRKGLGKGLGKGVTA